MADPNDINKLLLREQQTPQHVLEKKYGGTLSCSILTGDYENPFYLAKMTGIIITPYASKIVSSHVYAGPTLIMESNKTHLEPHKLPDKNKVAVYYKQISKSHYIDEDKIQPRTPQYTADAFTRSLRKGNFTIGKYTNLNQIFKGNETMLRHTFGSEDTAKDIEISALFIDVCIVTLKVDKLK